MVSVTQEAENGWRRWVCDVCQWCTEWAHYFDSAAAASAIRHGLTHTEDTHAT